MRKGNRHTGLFLDTGLLRDHVSKLREERRIAGKLYDNLKAMRNADDPSEAYKYNSALHDAKQLIEYFDRMANTFARLEDDAVELKNELGAIIKDDTAQLHHIVNNTFML